MPKETFMSQYEKSQDPGERHREPELSVHWGQTQGPDVQIGIALDPDAARTHLRSQLVERSTGLTPEQIDQVVAILTEPHSGALGWFTHLDRYDTNRLIRTLRRARDVAFGRDE